MMSESKFGEVVWEGVVSSHPARIVKSSVSYIPEVFSGNSISGEYKSAITEDENSDIFMIAWLDTKKKLEEAIDKMSEELSKTNSKLGSALNRINELEYMIEEMKG